MALILKLFKFVVFFWSFQVVLAWILSLSGIYRTSIVSVSTFIFIIVSIIFVLVKRQDIQNYLKEKKIQFDNLKNKKIKLISIMVLFTWITYFIYRLFFITLSPAVNWNSLTYHLTKAANAHQNGTWWFDPNITVDRVNFFGSNSSILNAVTFSIFGVDYLAELPQLVASTLIPLTLFYIGVKILKIRKYYSFIATISVLSIPLYLYESVTTQNDLVFTLLLLLSIIFVHRVFVNTKFDLANYIFAVLSIALLIGTKHHGIIAGGILGILLLYAFLKTVKTVNKLHLFFLITIALIFIVLAFPNNIISYIYYNSFIGLDVGDVKKVSPGFMTIWLNIKHFGEWFYLRTIGNTDYYSHDVGHPGIFNMIAAPLFIIVGLTVFIRRDIKKLIFFATILCTLLILFTIRNPDNWDLRLIIFLPISAVYVASLYILDNNKMIIRTIGSLVLLISVIFNLFLTLRSTELPIIKASVEKFISTGEFMSIGDYYYSRYMENIYDFEKHNKGKKSKIIIVGDQDSPIYPYFGKNWQNEIFFEKLKNIHNDYLSDLDWDYLIVYHNSIDTIKKQISELDLVYKKLTSDYYVDIYLNEIK